MTDLLIRDVPDGIIVAIRRHSEASGVVPHGVREQAARGSRRGDRGGRRHRPARADRRRLEHR